MAGKNIVIAGAVFNSVPSVEIPISGGGNAKFVETSDADATAADIANGKTAYVNGMKITGTGGGDDGHIFSFVWILASTYSYNGYTSSRSLSITKSVYLPKEIYDYFVRGGTVYKTSSTSTTALGNPSNQPHTLIENINSLEAKQGTGSISTPSRSYLVASFWCYGMFKIPKNNIDMTINDGIKTVKLSNLSRIPFCLGDATYDGVKYVNSVYTDPHTLDLSETQVETIESPFVYSWSNLTTLIMPPTVTAINKGTFYGNSNLSIIRFTGNTLTTFSSSNSLPAGVIIEMPWECRYMTLGGFLTSRTLVGYKTSEVGETLPNHTEDDYELTWYATPSDAKEQINPITQGNGNEVYCRYTKIEV